MTPPGRSPNNGMRWGFSLMVSLVFVLQDLCTVSAKVQLGVSQNPQRLADIEWARHYFTGLGFDNFGSKTLQLQKHPEAEGCGDIEFVIFNTVPAKPNPVKVKGLEITAESALKMNPGSCLTIITDDTSQFPTMKNVFLQRLITQDSLAMAKACNSTLGKSPCIMDITFVKMLYFTSYLRTLHEAGSRKHVVFLDPDLLFVRSIQPVFEQSFHVGLTTMCGEIGLMNPGVLICHGQHLKECQDFHQASTDTFVTQMYSHTGDQRSIGVVMFNEIANVEKKLKDTMAGKSVMVQTKSGWKWLLLPGQIFNATPTKLLSKDAVVLHYKGPVDRKKLQLEHHKKYWLKGKSHIFLRKYVKSAPKNIKCDWV